MQYRNTRGLTFATLGAGDINVRARPKLDLSGLNRDTFNMTRVTSSTSWSFTIPALNIAKLADDLTAAFRFIKTLAAEEPQSIQEKGEQAVALYRTAKLSGLSDEQLKDYISSEAFRSQLANRELYADLINQNAPRELVAFALYMSAQGERVYFDQSSKSFRVDGDCSTSGASGFLSPCGMDLTALAQEAKNRPDQYAAEVRKIALNAAEVAGKLYVPEMADNHFVMQSPAFLKKMEEAYACAASWSMLTGNTDALRELAVRTSGMNLAGTGLGYYVALTNEVLADAAANSGKPIDDRRIAIIADKLNDRNIVARQFERVSEHVYDGTAGLVLTGVIATPLRLAGQAGIKSNTTTLFHAVSAGEYADIQNTGIFRIKSGQNEMKQFAFKLDEAVAYANRDPSAVAIIAVHVDSLVINESMTSHSIDPFIFKSGVVTFDSTALSALNRNSISIWHAF